MHDIEITCEYSISLGIPARTEVQKLVDTDSFDVCNLVEDRLQTTYKYNNNKKTENKNKTLTLEVQPPSDAIKKKTK